METQELEKILEKLENLDIREWTYRSDLNQIPHPLTAKIGGLNFKLEPYCLEIEDISGGPYCAHYHACGIKNKPLKKMLTGFYQTICDKLKEYQKKEVEEKLKIFLSE